SASVGIGVVSSVSSRMAASAWVTRRYAGASARRARATSACAAGSISSALTRAMFSSCVPTVSSTSRLWRWWTSTPTTPTVARVTRTKTAASRTASRRQGRSVGGVGVAVGSITRSARRRRLEAERAVQRPGAGAAREQEEEDGRPREVLGVRTRVDEGLDHRDHAEQRQGGQPGGEAEDQEHRAADLERHRHRRGEIGGQQRQLLLVREQL